MESRRWTNMGQPQTLQIAVFLLYADAAFSVLGMLLGGGLSPFLLLAAAGSVAAGYGTANEKKWGYALAVAMSFFPITVRLLLFGGAGLLANPLNLMFEIALIALLLHPQSRDYQRIWFK